MFNLRDPQTTIIAILRLLMMVFAVVMYALGYMTLLKATAFLAGVNTLLGSYGFLAAKDSGGETTISKTTVQETSAGQVVKVKTELPSEETK
jgi:hypothetical protein